MAKKQEAVGGRPYRVGMLVRVVVPVDVAAYHLHGAIKEAERLGLDELLSAAAAKNDLVGDAWPVSVIDLRSFSDREPAQPERAAKPKAERKPARQPKRAPAGRGGGQKCARPGCSNVVPPSKGPRPRMYCTDPECRKARTRAKNKEARSKEKPAAKPPAPVPASNPAAEPSGPVSKPVRCVCPNCKKEWIGKSNELNHCPGCGEPVTG